MAEPLPWCHLNGERIRLTEARVSPLDRSFLFGDGIYEVIPVYDGKLFRAPQHLARLARSAEAIRIKNPYDAAQWTALLQDVVTANGGGDQYVYVQLSRGAEYGRNHAPLPDIEPTVFAYSSPWPVPSTQTLSAGVACITAEDTRWARCDIKSVALLANVLLRQLAVDAGAAETILLRNGELMEASASSVHVVRDGVVMSPVNSRRILPGTTRSVLEEILDALGIARQTAPVTEAQLRSADEVWLAAATREVQPVTSLDGKPVGNGLPGPVWRQVYDRYQLLKRA
ncbi:MAG: D-amino acid aminotransferase [Pseudomonadota bacterium]